MADAAGHSPERVSGIPVYSGEHLFVLEEMDRHIKTSRTPAWIAITNTESMYHAKRIPSHREFIEAAAFSLCDGVGVVIGGWFQGKTIRRFNGPILLAEAVTYGESRSWRHFFCGGKAGVADALAAKLKERCPGLEVAGTFCPPFRTMSTQEEDDMVRAINDSGADIVWVGLGLLKQESWIARYHKRLNVPWLIGVGAAFDFHAGTARWAPRWVQRLGFEWLYRLFFEPRMFVRNVYSALFLFEAIRDGVVMRVGKRGDGNEVA